MERRLHKCKEDLGVLTFLGKNYLWSDKELWFIFNFQAKDDHIQNNVIDAAIENLQDKGQYRRSFQ